MGSGVDYTQNGFESYIDSLYPEPVVGETETGFRVGQYIAQGGDENILRNEVGRWLNGRGTTSAEGKAFIEKYGWLFGGAVEKAAWGDTYIADERARDRRLGKTAYKELVMAQEAAAEGVLPGEDYIAFAMDVAEQMEQAEAAGKSLEDFLASGAGQLPDIADVIEENRAVKARQEEEREKAAAITMRETIEEADAAFASGTATAEQRELVKTINRMAVEDAVSSVPALAADRKNLTAELTAYAQTNMVGKLTSVYGPVHTVEADIAREAASNIANIAAGYFDDDYKRAAMMGLDMETYYELYPDRVLSPEEAYNKAFSSYTNTWSGVWETIGKQAQQAAAGQMIVPQISLADALTQVQADSAAYDKANKPEYQGEGVGVIRTAKSSAIAGSLAAAEGTLSAIQYFVTSGNDAVVEAANRAAYGNDPAAYRTALEAGIADINDPEERDAWKYLLDNYKGDIYNITFNFADQSVLNAMRSVQRNAAEVSEYIAKYGTEAENTAFQFGTSAVSNTIYMAETGMLASLGMPSAFAAAAVYGAPAGADMGRRLEAAGLSENAAKGAALGYAAFTGWLESSMIGEYIPNLAGKKATSLAKRGLGWLTKQSPEAMSKAMNWLVAMPVSEGVQEGLEYAAGSVYEGVFQSIAAGDIGKAGQELVVKHSVRDLYHALHGGEALGQEILGLGFGSCRLALLAHLLGA